MKINQKYNDRYCFSLVSAANEQHDPTSLAEAIPTPDKSKVAGTHGKGTSLNEVWQLVETPPNRRTVGSKWIYKWKLGTDGFKGTRQDWLPRGALRGLV